MQRGAQVFDIKWIRDNPEAFDKGLEARGIARGGEIKFSDELIALDEQRRAHLAKLQEAQARRNAASKEIGKAMAQKDQATADKLKAEVADLKNIGGRAAGTITAAAYLQEFVGDTPWAHLDIAGTAWNFTEKSYVPKGPSGIATRTLVSLVRHWKII